MDLLARFYIMFILKQLYVLIVGVMLTGENWRFGPARWRSLLKFSTHRRCIPTMRYFVSVLLLSGNIRKYLGRFGYLRNQNSFDIEKSL